MSALFKKLLMSDVKLFPTHNSLFAIVPFKLTFSFTTIIKLLDVVVSPQPFVTTPL